MNEELSSHLAEGSHEFKTFSFKVLKGLSVPQVIFHIVLLIQKSWVLRVTGIRVRYLKQALIFLKKRA